MNLYLFFIPLFSAIIGWSILKIGIAYFFKSYLPHHREQLSFILTNKIERALPLNALEEKMTSAELVEKTMPTIESHINEFLSAKLPQEIPMLAMFVGNKTTDKIKEVFIDQLKTLFPNLMGNIVGELKQNLNIQSIVDKQVNHPRLEARLRKQLTNSLHKMECWGLLFGLIIGSINLLILYIIR